MSIVNLSNLPPGTYAGRTASYRTVTKTGQTVQFLPGGGSIDASSRDPGNTDTPYLLRPGLPMGLVAATKLWKPSFIDVSQAATAASATSITLTPAGAAELVRRNGATGTFRLQGPPAANGTSVSQTVTYSAVNTGNGVVTTSAIAAATVAGSLVGSGDGSEVPRTVIYDGMGITVPADGSYNPQYSEILIEATLVSAKIIGWHATDTTIQAFLKNSMDAAGFGKFVFDDGFSPA